MTKPHWTPIRVTLGQLQPWEQNPKLSTKKDVEHLIETENKFGQPIPFCVSPRLDDGKYNCYDGHQRLNAWQSKYGLDFEVWAFQSDRHLTEQERKDFVLQIHQARGQWDWDKLSSWNTDELKAGWFDSDTLKGWKADVTALGEFLKSEQPTQDAEPETDRAAELLEKWGVELGQLWAIGEHKLICGDCTDAATVARVMGGDKADVVFTDPPYGIEYDNAERWDGIGKQNEGAQRTRGEMIDGDDKEFDPSFILSEFAYCKEIFLWGMQYYLGSLPNGGVIVWNRKTKEQEETPHADFELCWSKEQRHKMAWITWGGWKSKEKGEERLHTTQKPVELAVWFLEKWSKDHEIIVDLFAGSGFTLVACENLGRKCRAIEISPAYVAVALQRMQDAFGITGVRVE